MTLREAIVLCAVFAFAGCGGESGEATEADSDSAVEQTLELEIA
jgi:hypothetical protein